MSSHNILGTNGEQIAEEYLLNENYAILEKNWRFKKAEIDLIVSKGSRLIFVEVKTRSGNRFGQPHEFVSRGKKHLMALAADEYIFKKKHQSEVRFDIVSILFDNFGSYKIQHIEDAFWP